MDLYELCKSGDSKITVNVCTSDLLQFGEKIALLAVKEALERHDAKMYSKEEVAEKFNVSSTTLWRWTRQGIISSTKIGNKIYYPENEIIRLCESKMST